MVRYLGSMLLISHTDELWTSRSRLLNVSTQGGSHHIAYQGYTSYFMCFQRQVFSYGRVIRIVNQCRIL